MLMETGTPSPPAFDKFVIWAGLVVALIKHCALADGTPAPSALALPLLVLPWAGAVGAGGVAAVAVHRKTTCWFGLSVPTGGGQTCSTKPGFVPAPRILSLDERVAPEELSAMGKARSTVLSAGMFGEVFVM